MNHRAALSKEGTVRIAIPPGGYTRVLVRMKERAFCDLVYVAFACDLSRVGSRCRVASCADSERLVNLLMFTMFQSHMNRYPLAVIGCDVQEIGREEVSGYIRQLLKMEAARTVTIGDR